MDLQNQSLRYTAMYEPKQIYLRNDSGDFVFVRMRKAQMKK